MSKSSKKRTSDSDLQSSKSDKPFLECCLMPGSHAGSGLSQFRRSLSSREMMNHIFLESLFFIESFEKKRFLSLNVSLILI